MDNNGITIEKIFNAPVSEVWDAWINPDKIVTWWGPEGFTAPSAKLDFREGGKYVYCMRGPKGSEWDMDMYSGGEFKEIIPMKKIVSTDYFSDKEGNKVAATTQGLEEEVPTEMLIEIHFEDLSENQTKLTVFYPKPESDEALQAMINSGMEEGWSTSLDKLEKIL